MKVRVKLFGTLSQRFPDYQPSQGIEVEISGGATVEDLLAHLDISASQGVVVIAEGRVLKSDDEVKRGTRVNIMQTIGGG